MNKSQRIYLNTGLTSNVGVDKYIKLRLEQDVKTLEFLTLSLSTEDVYQNFNADYGVLVGRVTANGGVGIPNAKISVFIPLSDEDSTDGDITSIYPYKTPRDKNNEGKRYNLLPRVSQFNNDSGTYKPKQPFGSFFIKPEIVVNELFLSVYKKYYKYTALTNQFGDYMIFGVPTGTQTVHMSVDITDIGKYSMTPTSMIIAGYPVNLFTDSGNAIKASNDLNDLPNIETQEISVDVIPFWGDTENFDIGITRQDFRIKAILSSDFIIFGTTMTMGEWGIYGNPSHDDTNRGFYSLDTDVSFDNNQDIRTYRSVPPTIKVFTYKNDVPILDTTGQNLIIPSDIDFDKQIIQLDASEYFEYNVNGQFLLSIPCNRRKIITAEDGSEIIVTDDSAFGVFTRFYGMILIEYPSIEDLPQSSSWSTKYNGPNPQHKARGRMKIPQTYGLVYDDDAASVTNNNNWRKEYYTFSGGGVYSVAQFYPTKYSPDIYSDNNSMTENKFGNIKMEFVAGQWFKVAGTDDVTQSKPYDNQNYIINPSSGTTNPTDPEFSYDLSPNVTLFGSSTVGKNRWFGAQWLNFTLCFPQYGWAYGHGKNRDFKWADVFHKSWTNSAEPYTRDNNQKIFAGLKNTKNYLRGDAFQTAFINIPKSELQKLLDVPYKGINIRMWNNGNMYNQNRGTREQLGLPILSAAPYKYRNKTTVTSTNGQQYSITAWDNYDTPYLNVPSGEPKTAYLFKGMYENDCIQLLADFNII